MPVNLPGAPPAVAAALDRLKAELERAAGQNLAGLLLYGGLARGRYRPGESDVNVLVLLRDASADSLAALAPALQAAWRAVLVEPLLLTPAEVARAAAVFPTKFLDIKDHHVLLAGEDLFATLEIAREHIRLRAEQELRNLLLRLRRRYVAVSGDPALLARVLTGTARPFALELAALLRLAAKHTLPDDHTATIFESAAVTFGLEREPLARLAALRQDPRLAQDLPGLYGSVLAAVARAADVASRMKEPPP